MQPITVTEDSGRDIMEVTNRFLIGPKARNGTQTWHCHRAKKLRLDSPEPRGKLLLLLQYIQLTYYSAKGTIKWLLMIY